MIDFEELADQDLLQRDSDDEEDWGPLLVPKISQQPVQPAVATPQRARRRAREPINRRMQVLVLHGRQSNENMASFQIAPLKTLLSKDADFHFLEADRVWAYEPGRDLHDADPMSRTLSKGKDFKTWFGFETDDTRDRPDLFKQQDPAVNVTYDDPESAVDKLLHRVEQEGPVDAVVALFEGSIVVHLAVARCLAEGRPVPWRLSVLFGSLPIRDERYATPFAKKKAAHPTVHIFGRHDEYYFYSRTGAGRMPPEDYYERPIILEHVEGHRLPTLQPQAAEIFERVAAEMRYQCGLSKLPPKKVAPPAKPFSPPLLEMNHMVPRKLRVLALTGGHSCVEVLRFQTSQLKAALGHDAAEWFYLEGTKDWHWYEGEPTISELEEKLAKGRQLKNWYMDTCHVSDPSKSGMLNRLKQFDPTTWVEYHDVEGAVAQLKDYVMSEGPFDVLVAFSQGAIMAHLLIGHLRKERPGGTERWHHTRHGSEQMPWRMSVFFCGMHIRDKNYFHLFDTKSPHPTVHVFGKEDEYYEYSRDGFGNKPQEQYYEDPVILTHDQGHQFPTELPRAKEIYDRVTAEIWRHCGGRPLVL